MSEADRGRAARFDGAATAGGGCQRRACGLAVAAALALAPGCDRPTEVVVLCAASLQPALADAAAEFAADHPRVRIRLEPSGSLIAARKVTELGTRADLVAMADAALLEQMLVPRHAAFRVDLVANQMVLAHRDHSRFTDEITADNWPELLLRDGVRLGCVDPDTAPLGYRTRFVWQLAAARLPAAAGRDLDAALTARCAAHRVPDENELAALLEARAIDYAFLYRSTVETHHLKATPLGPEFDLSQPALVDRYAAAEVEVAIATGPDRRVERVRGAPVTYGITLLDDAPAREAAIAFLAFLLGDGGRRHFERMGFTALRPAPARPLAAVPAALAPLVVAAP